MKKIFTLISSILVIQVNAQTIYPSGVTNCIARYDFSTTQSTITSLQDVSGNANNSSIVENLVATTSWRGLANKAILFNGTSSYALIPNSSNLSPQAVTMVALVKMNGFYQNDCQFSQILCKGYPGYISGQYSMAVGDDVYDHDCHIFDEKHQQLIGYFNNSYTIPGMLPNPGNYIKTDKWYFLAITFNGTSLTYYQVPMDASFHYDNIAPMYSSSNIPNSMGDNNQDISIGKHTNPIFPYWFNGVMDEVVLFNKILSAKEMQSVYDYLWKEGVTDVASVNNEISDFSLYPNPNNGAFTIIGNTTDKNLSYQIINAIGQTVYTGTLLVKNGSIKQEIYMPNVITSGAYSLILKQADPQVVKRLSIVKK